MSTRWALIVFAVASASSIFMTGANLLAVDEKPAHSGQPAVGDAAKDFALDTMDGKTVRLSELTKKGPVVLVVLRGWVGYQCPICTRQVGELRAHANELSDAGANVVLVYPGPAQGLK